MLFAIVRLGLKNETVYKRKPACRLLFWRRVRDSNSREIALNLISSQARYDHFDNPPDI